VEVVVLETGRKWVWQGEERAGVTTINPSS